MLSKCANPNCSAELRYLRAGKVFKIETDTDNTPFLVDGRKPVRRVEHFWLCGDCSEGLTLKLESGDIKVVAKPVALPIVRAAAAAS